MKQLLLRLVNLDKIQLLCIVTYPVFWAALGHSSATKILGAGNLGLVFCISGCISLLWFCLLLTQRFDRLMLKFEPVMLRLNLILGSLTLFIYDYTQYHHFAFAGYSNPKLLYILDTFALALVLFITLHKTLPLRRFMPLAMLICLTHLILSIKYFPVTPLRSDMLVAINGAISNFMLNLSPYVKVYSYAGIIPYLPITWVSFIPVYILHLDFRIAGVIYLSIMFVLIYIKLPVLNLRNYALLFLFMLNPSFLLHHELYFWFFMLELVIFYLYNQQLNNITGAILLGVMISTLQFAWVLFPFLLFQISKTRLQLIVYALVALIIFILTSYYFSNQYIQEYIKAIFLHQEFGSNYDGDVTFGISALFYFMHNQFLLLMVQVLFLAVLFVLATKNWFKQVKSTSYLTYALYAYVVFIATCFFIDKYFYIPIMLLAAIISKKNSELLIK